MYHQYRLIGWYQLMLTQCRKIASISSAVHRLFSLPLIKDDYESEIAEIQKIAEINELNIDIALRTNLPQLLERIKQKKT